MDERPMSSSVITPELIRNCRRCSRELAPGALECQACHALVYADEINRLAAQAKQLESQGDLLQARYYWLNALPLMPPHSSQAAWIQNHARELEQRAAAPTGRSTKGQWAKRLAPLGPLAVFLAKFKSLLLLLPKLKFLLSFAAFIGLYWAWFGPRFGIGFAVMILIHEMGHFIDVKRRGLPAEMPVFLPGLGAYVRWQAMGVPLETRAAVSLAGPLAGWFAAAVCALLWFHTHDHLWAALAQVGAWLNLINLIPVAILDGGHAALALSKTERMVLVGACLALWLLLNQELFILIALGFVWRLFTKDAPANPSPKTLTYFLTALTLLGIVRWLVLVPGSAPR
jgi:Zn-dependent protease